jgi:hypothetical protein
MDDGPELRWREDRVNLGPGGRSDGDIIQRTMASREHESMRQTEDGRRGKFDLDGGDHQESTHAAGSSQWRKPDLEEEKDQDSTYPDERHRWRNPDPGDDSCGSTRLADGIQRRKPDLLRMVSGEGERKQRPSCGMREREGDWTTDEDSDDSLMKSRSLERRG